MDELHLGWLSVRRMHSESNSSGKFEIRKSQDATEGEAPFKCRGTGSSRKGPKESLVGGYAYV